MRDLQFPCMQCRPCMQCIVRIHPLFCLPVRKRKPLHSTVTLGATFLFTKDWLCLFYAKYMCHGMRRARCGLTVP